MQEVIVKLREEAPKMEIANRRVEAHFARARGLCSDLEMATSDEGRSLLRKALAAAMVDFVAEYEKLQDSIKAICAVNTGYKEKLGVSRRRKTGQKDAPGQQMLDLGHPVTSGQSTSGAPDTPDTPYTPDASASTSAPTTGTALPANATAQGFDTHRGGTAVG
jgi:hypothetical protein